MANKQVKIDLSHLSKEQRQQIERLIQDSECLRNNFDKTSLPHWRMFHHLGLVFINFLQSREFYEYHNRDYVGDELMGIWRKLGCVVEHLEKENEIL